MDSKVVHSHVQEESDEQNSQNVEPYPETLTHGPEEPTEPEKKSVMSRVKAKARKVRDSIKKHTGQQVNTNENQDTPDDDGDLDEEDKEVVQDPQVPQVPSEKPHYNPLVGGASLTTAVNQKNATDSVYRFNEEQHEANLERSIVSEEEDSQEKGSRPEAYTIPNYQTKDTDPSGEVYDNEDVKIATPTPESERVENLGNSGIDIENTKVKGEESYDDTPVEGDSSTTEINQNIANDEKPEQYNLEKPVIVSEEYPVKQGTRTETYTLPNYQISHTAPSGAGNDQTPFEESFERLNVHDDEPKPTTETTIQPSVADTEYPPAAGSHDRSVPHFSDVTTTENEYPQETVSTHIIRDNDILEDDSQDQGTEAYNLPNYPIKDTDQSGAESNKIKDITPPLEESLERLNVHDDESKAITEQKFQPSAAAADTEYPLKFSDVSHDQFVSHLSDVTETQNEYPQQTVSTDINRNHEIPSETEETFNTITNTVENKPHYEKSVETQPKEKSYTDETEISSAEKVDKTLLPESYEASNLGNDGTSPGSNNDGTETKNGDKGATEKDLVEKLRPSEDDLHKGKEALHHWKEEPLKNEDEKLDSEVEKPEKVLLEEGNVDSPGKGMVDRVKDYYGSWFAKPEDNQSPQGAGISTEDLSKNKDSVAEVKQVDKVVD